MFHFVIGKLDIKETSKCPKSLEREILLYFINYSIPLPKANFSV